MSLALVCGIFLDLILGDPRSMPHPVRWIGGLIGLLFRTLDPRVRGPWTRRLAGLGISALTIGGVWVLAWTALRLLGQVWPPLAWMAGAWMVWTSLSLKDLMVHLGPIREALSQGDQVRARAELSLVVGRRTEDLDRTGVVRAGLETLAENLSDGVTAPLFYILLLGPAGGLAYKAVNTLDSMLGYKQPPYKEIGLFPARIDDLVNLIPARITFVLVVAAAAAMSLNPGRSFRAGMAEHGKSASPNAGWPEAALAGALDVSLLGPAVYGDVLMDKPFLNPLGRDPGLQDLDQGAGLIWTSGLIAYLAAISAMIL